MFLHQTDSYYIILYYIMNNYIQEYKNSLSPEFCQHVIDLFESEPNKKPGIYGTERKIDISKKKTMDYMLLYTDKNENWLKVEEQLFTEIQSKLLQYIKHLEVTTSYNNFSNRHIDMLTDQGFLISRYIEKDGKFTYHTDNLIDWEHNRSRVNVFIWYLNDVVEGGETEFWGSYKIKPEVGKLVFFPTTWTFPHCGCIPMSNNKYIITGWLYEYKKENTEKIISIDMKEKMDAFVKLFGGNFQESNDNESNEEKEEREKFRKSYGRVYYLT